jgi:general stress protein 26
MSRVNDETVDVSKLLAGAAAAVRGVPFCWLATTSEDGLAHVRPMGPLRPDPGEGKDEWTIRFLTDGRSRKAADLRRSGRVTVIVQHDPSLAFVTLTGTATLHDTEPEVRRRWKDAYDAIFPTEEDRAAALFLDVDVERMDLLIRGVTPEPFGIHTTTIERDAGGAWRAVSP